MHSKVSNSVTMPLGRSLFTASIFASGGCRFLGIVGMSECRQKATRSKRHTRLDYA
jgi:hypothetical protein